MDTQVRQSIANTSLNTHLFIFLREASWGGAIEAQILSEHFGIVITVIDTKSGSMTDFGEGIGSSQRMILVYDGIHYDALCKDEGENR